MKLSTQYIIVYTTTFLTMIFLGTFVYFKDRKKKLNQIYFVFNLTVACWSFFHALVVNSKNPASALFFSRFSNLGIIFIAPTYLHFAFVILNVNKEKMRRLILAYSISLFFLIFIFTKLFISGVSHKITFNYIWSPGILYPFFTFYWFSCVIYALYELFKEYIHSSGKKRNQLKYLFWGLFIGYLGGAGNFLLIFGIEVFPYNPFGTYGVPLYAIILTYAIIVHNLLDLNIVVRKTLIYSGLVGFITIINVIAILLFENIFRGIFGYKSLFLTLCTASIIAITFLPIYRLINSFVNKIFFKKPMAVLARENELLREEINRSERLAAVGVMASGLAHEIKNPLTPIKMKIGQLPNHLTKEQQNMEFFKKFNTTISYEINRITGLLEQLREFANPSSLAIKQINITELLDNRISLLSEVLKQRNIKVITHYTYPDILISADCNKLDQVFLNLFLNATDAMPYGGTLTISTEIGSNNKISIKVSDTGIGIPKEDLPHIFDPFFSKGKKKGSGLGLAVAHQIIKSHNGIIQAESIFNEGTTFYIYLPFKNQVY